MLSYIGYCVATHTPIPIFFTLLKISGGVNAQQTLCVKAQNTSLHDNLITKVLRKIRDNWLNYQLCRYGRQNYDKDLLE